MGRTGLTLALVWFLCPMVAVAVVPSETESAIDAVLTSLHQAASDADGELYFSLFADDAVFMGTDATERWSVD